MYFCSVVKIYPPQSKTMLPNPLVILLTATFTVAFVALVVWIWGRVSILWRRKHGGIEVKSPAQVEYLLRSTGAEVQKTGEMEYNAIYQGGLFQVTYRKECNTVDVIFSHFLLFPSSSLMAAFMAENAINRKYWGLTSYIVLMEKGEAEQSCVACMSYRLPLQGDVEHQKHALTDLFRLFFQASREFVAIFNENNATAYPWQEITRQQDENNAIAWLIAQHEARTEASTMTSDGTASGYPLLLSRIMERYFHSDMGVFAKLLVFRNGTVEENSSPAALRTTTLESCLKDPAGGTDQDPATTVWADEVRMEAVFEEGSLFFQLVKLAGSDTKTLFYRLNVVPCPKEKPFAQEQDKDNPLSSIIRISLQDDKQREAEARYRILELTDKLGKEGFHALTHQEQYIAACALTQYDTDAYWAVRLLSKRCYVQALALYERILRGIQSYVQAQNDDPMTIFIGTATSIGTLLMELKREREAFYFLHIAQESGLDEAVRSYANCLTMLRDFRAMAYVNEQISRLDKERKEGNVLSQEDEDLYRFLERKRLHLLVLSHQFDQAESIINEMLEDDENAGYARQMQRIILSKRKQESQKTDEENHNTDAQNRGTDDEGPLQGT